MLCTRLASSVAVCVDIPCCYTRLAWLANPNPVTLNPNLSNSSRNRIWLAVCIDSGTLNQLPDFFYNLMLIRLYHVHFISVIFPSAWTDISCNGQSYQKTDWRQMSVESLYCCMSTFWTRRRQMITDSKIGDITKIMNWHVWHQMNGLVLFSVHRDGEVTPPHAIFRPCT